MVTTGEAPTVSYPVSNECQSELTRETRKPHLKLSPPSIVTELQARRVGQTDGQTERRNAMRNAAS